MSKERDPQKEDLEDLKTVAQWSATGATIGSAIPVVGTLTGLAIGYGIGIVLADNK